MWLVNGVDGQGYTRPEKKDGFKAVHLLVCEHNQRLYTRLYSTKLLHTGCKLRASATLLYKIMQFQRHIAIPQVPYSRCINIIQAQKFEEENRRIGGAEEILVFVRRLFNYQDDSLLTLSLLSDQSFRSYRGHFFISIRYQSLQQDPNAITQSFLTKISISQQLPRSSNATTSNPQVHQSMPKILWTRSGQSASC